MSFNKNNPNAMGKIMGYLKQLSTDMSGSEQQRRSQNDEERLYKSRGPKYARVPSKATLSASTTCTSLATSCGSSATLAPNIYATIPEHRDHHSTESSSDDEQETFEKTRLHFQQLRQISLGNEYKYKMEMEIKSAKDENLRNSVPFVKQLSTDSVKAKGDYSINGDRTPSSTKQRPYLFTQVLAAFALSMGSLIVGFSSGYTSPALTSMRNSTLQITKEEETWVSGLMPLAAMVGGLFGGPLIDYLGRRNTITAIAVPFFVGWMLIANANVVQLVLAGRALCGICVGVGSLAFPVYLAEAVQREVRGVLGLLPTAFGNIGILLCSVVGPYLDWSELAFFGAALPIPFIILMLIIPESPNWYMSRGRVDDARKALQWLRGKKANVEREIRDIALSKAESDRAGGGLLQKKYIRSVAITLGLMLFQQLTGINAVIFYTKDIFSEVGNSGINDNWSAIIIGLVNFSSTFLATVLIDRLGRKILLYISSISVIITLCSLGAYFYLKNVSMMETSAIGWLPLASMIIYVLGFSLGFGPIPWLMMGEILPASIRGSAAAMATAFNWTCTFIVTKTFPNIIISIGLHGTFWMFGCITVLGLFFVIFFVPETRGKSLEEIELNLTGGGTSRRMSSIANMKPLPNGC